MNDLEQRAKIFATRVHTDANQRRKYTHAPYIIHPAAVVELVRIVPHTAEMIAAAWLHDTVEDTTTTLREINQHFGDTVASYVQMLTKVSRENDGDREVRFQLDLVHISCACPQVKTIKLADIIDNSRNIAEYDPEFAKYYLVEKHRQLAVLRQGDKRLLRRAEDVIRLGLEEANRRLRQR
ncbi:hypothetical protein SOASR032_32780 [Pragia fontium]|uniref:HD/PDEase domain-containing protein n=1 Tax=Pragia fontium TaxID=82985 RepID=A0ABQ5LMU7_9GAMM|nr:HD domain-containing protein [Pragia fontium]GKX64709.1 hypothetical protein SOASR032_32780 [Pragia fontium]